MASTSGFTRLSLQRTMATTSAWRWRAPFNSRGDIIQTLPTRLSAEYFDPIHFQNSSNAGKTLPPPSTPVTWGGRDDDSAAEAAYSFSSDSGFIDRGAGRFG